MFIRFLCSVCGAIVVMPFVISSTARAESRESSEWAGGPYCGVYSLYAAFAAEGIRVDLRQLLTPNYIGSEKGSTLAELEKAVSDFGAHGIPMQNLNVAFLEKCSHPIILHVRLPGKGTPYTHWVLFLGVDGNLAKIVDPPLGVQNMAFSQLLSMCDGIGLVVSRDPPNILIPYLLGWIDHVTTILSLVLVLWVAQHWTSNLGNKVTQRFPSSRKLRSFGFAVRSIGVAFLVSTIWHLTHSEGFVHNPSAIGQVKASHFDAPVGSITLEEMRSRIGCQNVYIIDARLSEDYAFGHVEGAINIPIISGWSERERILSSIPHHAEIIVYCQSTECEWGKSIASDLVFRGYQKVFVFPDGWMGWSENRQNKH